MAKSLKRNASRRSSRGTGKRAKLFTGEKKLGQGEERLFTLLGRELVASGKLAGGKLVGGKLVGGMVRFVGGGTATRDAVVAPRHTGKPFHHDVFDSEEQYNQSVESVVARIKSGQVQRRILEE